MSVILRFYVITVAETLIFVNNSIDKMSYGGFSKETPFRKAINHQRLPMELERQRPPVSYVQSTIRRYRHSKNTIANVRQIFVLCL